MKPVMIKPGTLLQGRYRMATQIGQGGMGEVYVATDERFQSTVAIKRTFYDDPEMLKAFEREARLLNRLRHAALPKVSDHFSERGGQFLVMEFIEGSDLSELLKQRKVPFPLADVLRWADEMLEALDYLHTQEPPVVHRDIKPSNIKLTPQGKVVLLDFGLAKGMPAQTDSGTTQSVFGYSLSFAPLEQIQGSGTDPRSDLYSLAATLYFLLTGLRPTDALTRAAATVKQHPDPLRPAHLLQAQVPAAIGQILHRAMSQNSALRHASAAELRAALRQATSSTTRVEATPQIAPVEMPVQLQEKNRPAAEALLESDTPSWNLQLSSQFAGESIGSASRRRQLLYDSYTVSAGNQAARTGSATRPKVIFVACLLAIFIAASAYMLSGASGSHSPAANVGNAEAQNPAPTSTQIAPTETKMPATGTLSSDSLPSAPASNTSAQSGSPRSQSETQASNSQASTGAYGPAGSDAKGGSATPDSANSAASASTSSRQALVIQNPTPATSGTNQAGRADESIREQRAYRPEDNNVQPLPYPPPPGDRRPPPPPDGRRPPPRRPPYP